MNESELSLPELDALARKGNLRARAEINRRLAPHLPRIVRRALREESRPTRLNRAIRQTAAGLPPSAGRQAPADAGIVQRVTRRLLELVSGKTPRLAPVHGNLHETVRF